MNDTVCGFCLLGSDECQCPPCPQCGLVGDNYCYQNHGYYEAAREIVVGIRPNPKGTFISDKYLLVSRFAGNERQHIISVDMYHYYMAGIVEMPGVYLEEHSDYDLGRIAIKLTPLTTLEEQCAKQAESGGRTYAEYLADKYPIE